MKPLAYRLRPKDFSDIIGQDHLVGNDGIIRKMVEQRKLFSIILQGNPGTGKTSIAHIIASTFDLNHAFFNASTDTKAKLKDIVESAQYQDVLLIVDEIHRMKADIQDFLLPCMEDGSVTVIGLTTVNAYTAVNPAIRSRCHVFQLNPISLENIAESLRRAIRSNEIDIDVKLHPAVETFIAEQSHGEIRTALNILETIVLMASDGDTITLPFAKMVFNHPALGIDKSGDHHYDALSALQKSIRGSDVDASLHYLARLIVAGDLDFIIRRLLVIAYEDIGLANPNIGPKAVAACEAAKIVGFPEARIPLSVLVVDLALSPKSNTPLVAIDQAISEYKAGKTGFVPKHLKNTELWKDSSLYKYPHDYPDAFVLQQYLPDAIKNTRYFFPKETGKYEKALKERLEWIELQKKKP